jgi:hypothetical protein
VLSAGKRYNTSCLSKRVDPDDPPQTCLTQDIRRSPRLSNGQGVAPMPPAAVKTVRDVIYYALHERNGTLDKTLKEICPCCLQPKCVEEEHPEKLTVYCIEGYFAPRHTISPATPGTAKAQGSVNGT